MKSFSAVIFDMDGVLVDSEPLHQRAFERLFAELGRRDDHGIVFADYYGRSDKALLTDFIALHALPHRMEELWERKVELFLADLRQSRPIFADARALVSLLAARYPLAIASSNTHRAIEVVMEISGFRPHFRAIVGLEDLRAPKPDPDAYLQAAARLGLAPADCVAVEDAAAGVAAARAAGMRVIAITTSLPAEKLSASDRVVNSHRAIGELLLNGGF